MVVILILIPTMHTLESRQAFPFVMLPSPDGLR
jgi:hypothetical protein